MRYEDALSEWGPEIDEQDKRTWRDLVSLYLQKVGAVDQYLACYVVTAFADPQSQQMLEELANLKHSLRETKGVLAIWKDKGLSQKEKYEL